MSNSTTTMPVYQADSYSNAQNIAIAIVPKFSGTLSLLGSLFIVISILGNKCNNNNNLRSNRSRQRRMRSRRTQRSTRKRSNVQMRLLLGLSICDIIQSTCHIMSTWPIPRDTIYGFFMYNVGNQTTCTIQGFLLLFGGLSVPIYNTSLCLYYYICVKFPKMSDQKIASRIEPFLHFVATMLPLGLCIFGSYNEMFNPAGTACFICMYPSFCDVKEYECIRGENANQLRTPCVLIIFTCFIIMVTSLSMLYYEVRKQERRMSQYDFQMRQTYNETGGGVNDDSYGEDNDNSNMERPRRSSSFSIRSSMSSASSAIMDYTSNLKRRRKSKNAVSSTTSKNKSTRKVFLKSLYYVIPFMLVLSPTLIQLAMAAYVKNEMAHYCIVVIIGVFSPLQGAFNALIFFEKRVKEHFNSVKACIFSGRKQKDDSNIFDNNNT